MSDDLLLNASPCPSCGVSVTTGYPRCPKCHAPMPGATGQASGSHALAGGTAVPQSSGNAALITGAVVGLALIAGTVFFLMRGSGDKKKDREVRRIPVANKTVPQPGNDVDTNDDGTTVDSEVTPTPPTPPTGIDSVPGKAAAVLRRALEKKRLWTEVEIDGTRLTLRTTYCEDSALRGVLAATKVQLSAAGLKGATCYAKHGKLIFEEDF